jgi:hypothetical protein
MVEEYDDPGEALRREAESWSHVRRALERILRRKISDTDWLELVAYLGTHVDEELWIEDALSLLARRQLAQEASKRPREAEVERSPRADYRWEALAEVLAIEAAADPSVES